MAEVGTLHDAFIDELRDAYSAEKQLVKALPKMAKAAASAELREAFEIHLEETRGHVQKLEQVFETLDEKVRGKHCDGMAGIIEEGKSVMEEDFDESTMDACLIASAQRAEHYEMAAYGTLVAWAKAMGHDEAGGMLEEILNEEKAADEKLSGLAEGGINEAAAAGVQGDDEDEEEKDEEEEEIDEDEEGDEGAEDVEADEPVTRAPAKNAGAKKPATAVKAPPAAASTRKSR